MGGISTPPTQRAWGQGYHLLRQRLRKVLTEAPMQNDAEELGMTVGSEEVEEMLSGIDEVRV